MSTMTTLRGTPAFGAGKFGNALTAGALGTTTNYVGTVGTVEAWVQTTATGLRVAAGNDNAGANGSFWIGQNGTPRAAAGIPSGTILASSVAINDGAWHHLALTLDGSTARLWVDGTLGASTASATALPSAGTTAIGGFGANNGFEWSGAVDEFRISNTVRYTTTFTPPASAFTDDSSTFSLYHLEADGTDSHGAGGGADTTAPTVPTGLTATPGNAQVGLSWTASTDNVAVTGYRVYRGGTITGSPTGTSYTDTGLTNGTTYSYTVAAIDAAGNLSAQTSAVTATPAATPGSIAPNDGNIAYSPYTWDVTATRAKTINPGAYLSALLTGTPTSITATFDMTSISAPVPQISYRVDGGPWATVAAAASVTLPIPSTDTWAKHLVELRVKSSTQGANRWNSPQNTAVAFTGFTVAPNTVTTSPVRKKRFNLLCYGDSITEGSRTLGSTQTNDTDQGDSALSWAYPLGQLLGAEVGVVGFGATGLTVAGAGNVPALPTSYNLLWAGLSRTFTPAPDLVLIHAGTNDSGDVTANATTVLNGILTAATTAKIAVVQQWNGTGHKTQWQAAIAACTAPSRVTYVDTTGWWSTADSADGLHPYGYVNVADLAPRLAAAVGPILTPAATASKRFVNVAGTAKAIG